MSVNVDDVFFFKFGTLVYCQPMPPSMSGPAGAMNVPGQMNQPYPGQMPAMVQQSPVVSINPFTPKI